ncbi:MAG: membrane dipeptidase [Saprospiraceae bacterium]|nr:membrane dipeptidase [Saprospiraceae bacterium]
MYIGSIYQVLAGKTIIFLHWKIFLSSKIWTTMNERRDFIKISAAGVLALLTSRTYKKPHSHFFIQNVDNRKLFFGDQEPHPLRDRAREIAINILKPSKRDLEHGLELHAESLVFDTYGFMPRAAYDGAAIAQLIDSGASPLEIKDLQEDHSMCRFVDNDRERYEFIENWKASGVTAVFQNAGEEGNAIDVLIKRLARFTYATDMMSDTLIKAVKTKDLHQAKQEGKHALYFSGNGVPMPLDLVSVEEELRYIRVFYQLGIRMMHLTYNRRNLIGDGCGERSDAGLSDFGREVVREMNRVGVLVDVAHSGWQTSLEAAELSSKPMVASHSTCAGLFEHIRSKPDRVIAKIADTGGYIGICCIPRFLGGDGNIAKMMQHIDYVVRHFGADHVGIGTDVAASSQYSEQENALIPAHYAGRNRWEALWPKDTFTTTQEMKDSMMWTNWPLFTVGLVQLGYSDSDIQKIIGGNAVRVLKTLEIT